MERILVIDDDVELCSLIAEYLQAEGFGVDCVHDGESGLQKSKAGNYLLAVLDVMLPGINGFEVLRRVRAVSRLPVLLLTARGEEVDRIVGLEIGADDYLPKPFNPRELVARIRAILRRTHGEGKSAAALPEVLRVGEVELDPATRTVLRDGKPVDLTSVEFNLLEVLLVRPRRAHHEKPVPENLLFVLAGHRIVRRARDFGCDGLSPAAQSHLGVVAQHRPG